EWADAHRFAVEQDGLRVRIEEIHFTEGQVALGLILENIGKSTGIGLTKWGSASGRDKPNLIDDKATSYALVPNTQLPPSAVIAPGDAVVHRLAFRCKGSIRDANYLRLELPASAFDGFGQLRLEMPKIMIQLRTASARGSQAIPELTAFLLNNRSRKIRGDA